MRTYERPMLERPVRAIQPQEKPNTLGPETEVTILFRGGPPVVDMFDSRSYVIPPVPEGLELEAWRKTFCSAEHFTIPYGIALHLQSRAIVPGTRNRTDYRKVASQIAILNIDRAEYCQPFTPEQLERFGDTYKEGIDREGELVVFKDVRAVVQNAMVQHGVDLDAAVEDAAAAPHAPAPEGGAGVAAAQAAEGAAAAAGRKGFSATRPGKVTFADDPSKAKQ